MAVPKRKTSLRRQGNRNAHSALKKIVVTEDQTSGTAKRPHHVASDGYHRGRKVTNAKVNH